MKKVTPAPREIATGKRPRGRKHLNKTRPLEKQQLTSARVPNDAPQFDQTIHNGGPIGMGDLTGSSGPELGDDYDAGDDPASA